MTELQTKLLEMLKWLHEFISSHNLRYYIFEGTVLGAIRHKGFIPWDDDIDIVMPRSDYEVLCELMKKPIDHYVIETPYSLNSDFVYPFAKFYDINTTMTEHLRKDVIRGVYIDIFPIDGLGNSLIEARKNYKKIDRKNMFLMTRVCSYRKDRKWYKNLAIFLGRLIPSFLINEHKYCQKIDKLNKKLDYDEYQYFGVNMSTYRDKDIHNKSILGNPTEYEFEGIKIWGPEKFEEYLTETYGDWRILPPKEKRHSSHDFINLDLNSSYLEKVNVKY